MNTHVNAGPQASSGVVLGALLVVAGFLFLVFRFAPWDVAQYGWPAFVVGTGFAFLVIGLLVRPAVGLVIPGTIIAMVGGILAVQNAFGLWGSWSYAWALVFPTSVGIGIAIMGLVRHDRSQASQGAWTAAVGLTLFAVFAMFFEGLMHVSGVELGVLGTVFPVFLIALGLVLMFATVLRGRPIT
jgi:hypothetical protein